MRKELPQIIKDVGFDFGWDEPDVWGLDYPIEDADISLLDWHFDVPFWNNGEEWYSLKPIDVMGNKEKWADEYERTMRSDLSYPIDIMENKGRWVILDGLHRLLKYRLLGETKIKVRKIPRSEISNISRQSKERK